MDPPLKSLFGEAPIRPERSALMARVRGKGTGPELALRKALWTRGARFRCNSRRLPGWPDISNSRAHVVVFVDGCFWHGCPDHFTIPKTRTQFWLEKVRRNRAKREQVRAQYDETWQVFEVYECELKDSLQAVADRLAPAFLRARAI